jgi:CheY-like chemotaxis protein
MTTNQPHKTPDSAPDTTMEILLVDDDAAHVELVRRNLRRAGVTSRMVALHTGQAAVDYVFRTGPYADRPTDRGLLILLDINMPGSLDGVEVLRRIKADPLTRSIPIIMLTTTDDPREIARCYALGCSVYVTKPVAPQAFVEAITRLGLFFSIVSVPPERGPEPA